MLIIFWQVYKDRVKKLARHGICLIIAGPLIIIQKTT
jgi:hypothetical protein